MRWFIALLIVNVVAIAGVAGADDPPRRTSRVASGPVRPSRGAAGEPESPHARPTPRPATPPSIDRPAPRLPGVLEPAHLLEGVGRGMVVCFQVEAAEAVSWRLVVREVDGPLARVFEGEGPPPLRLPWDGRLHDGGLAWSGMAYTYHLTYVDSTGVVGELPGGPFTLPAYTHEDPHGISFLIPGRRLAPRTRGDPVAAAAAGLASVAERLDRPGGSGPVRIEVLARDEDAALTLGEAVRTALADLLGSSDRALDLYVGEAAAAPVEGTVLVTTVSLSGSTS